MDQRNFITALRENGSNLGIVGTPWPESTLIEEAVNAEQGMVINVSEVRYLSRDQSFEAENVLSLTHCSALRMNRDKAQHLLRYYHDLLNGKENSCRSNQEPKVMAMRQQQVPKVDGL